MAEQTRNNEQSEQQDLSQILQVRRQERGDRGGRLSNSILAGNSCAERRRGRFLIVIFAVLLDDRGHFSIKKHNKR